MTVWHWFFGIIDDIDFCRTCRTNLNDHESFRKSFGGLAFNRETLENKTKGKAPADGALVNLI